MTDRTIRPRFDTDPVAAADAHAAVDSLVAGQNTLIRPGMGVEVN
jgi:hypothetical protein